MIPGYLLVARHGGMRRILDRGLVALAAGLLVAPVIATLLDLCGLPVIPAVYLAVVVPLALGAERWPSWRRGLAGVGAFLGDAPPWTAGVVLGVGVLLALVVIGSLEDLPVPPTVHDAANHSFMTLRIARTGSYDPSVVFGPPWGAPAAPYLFGWHVTAALVARVSGLPPYVTTWYLPLVCLFLLPALWAQLWRACGVGVAAAVTAAALVPANPSAPAGLLGWGGFGVLVGMALVPLAALILAALVARPRAATAVAAGVALVGLVHIHAGEVALALLAAAVLMVARREEWSPGRWSPAAVLALAGVLALLLLTEPWQTVATYRAERMVAPPADTVSLGQGLDYLWRGAGPGWGLRFLLVTGVVWSARRRTGRPLVVAAACLGILVLGLMVWQDPVTRWLATPFYAGWVRTRAALMLFLPVLLALPLVDVAAAVGRRRPALRRYGPLLVAAMVVLLVRPGLMVDTRRDLGSRAVRDLTVFDDQGWQVARRLEDAVPAGGWVANSYDDGTAWGLHVGRRPHRVPCGGGLTPRKGVNRNQGVVGLLERPWSPLTRRLAAHGVTHFFASNRYMGGKRTTDIETFGADDRFEPVIRRGDFALYRIRWESEGVAVHLDDRSRE